MHTHRRRSTQRTWTQLFSSRVKSELTLRSLMSTERREVSPEPPSTPKPTSQSPRSTDRINTENVASDHVASVIATAGHDKESETETTSPNRWLLAAKKISEKKKAPTQELLRRLSATKNEIVNQYESKMHNVSDKAFTSLNSKEKKSLLKANEKVQKSLNKELKLQAAIHKMAARVVIQYNITIDEALSLAETEIRDEVELSRQKKLKQKGTMKSSTAASSSQHSDTRLSSLSLEEEVKQYAHDLENNEYLDYENALIIARREVPFARAEKEKINASNNVDSTDQLFATLFKREVENDNNEKGDVKVTTIQQRDNHHDEKIVKQGNDESKADIETPLLASVEQVVGGDEAPIPQEKDKQSFKAQPPLSAPDKDKDTSNERKKETSHSSVKPADQHKPHVPNKRFSLAVGAIMKENKAKKELFKSLGKSAVMSKTAPAGVLSIHSNAEDEDEERRKESKEDIIKSNSSGGLPRQKDLKQNQELAAQNKNLSTTVGKVMTVQKLASNPFLTRAKSSVGALSRPTTSSSSSVTSAVNLLARTTITPTDRTLSMVKGPFENSNITRDEVRVNSANRDKSEKKLRKMEAKRQAETAKFARKEANDSFHRAQGAVEMLNREKNVQNLMQSAEISLQTASQHFTSLSTVVADNATKLSKHERAVQALLQEAERIKKRQEITDEATKLLLFKEEESRLIMSEQQKNAYYSEWSSLQADLAALSEQTAIATASELRAEMEDSSFLCHLRDQAVQASIAEEVQRALASEKLREERAILRFKELEKARCNFEELQGGNPTTNTSTPNKKKRKGKNAKTMEYGGSRADLDVTL